MLLGSLAAALAGSLTAAFVVAPSPPTQGATAPSAAKNPDASRVSRGYLRASGVDGDALLEAVALRVKSARWAHFGPDAASADDGLTAVVQLGRQDPALQSYELTIIVSDGRAYDRPIDTRGIEDKERVRLVASNVANLIAGLEAGTVAPDRSDVPLPEPSPAVVCPEVPPCPAPQPLPEAAPTPSPPAPATVPAVAELSVYGGLPVVLGLGAPADADRFSAWGGTVGVALRLRRGATVALDIRPGGRGTLGGVRLVRGRIGVGAGYTFRRGAFELSALGLAVVEPWVVRVDGARAVFVAGSAQRRLVLGGAAHLAPGLRVELRRTALRVGPFGELSFSGSAAGGFAVPRVVLPSEEASRIRIGGLEAVVGMQVAVWFRLGARATANP